MTEPIRVLHVFGKLNRAGAETMIMNLYRNINRSKIQFDFIVHTEEKCDYDEEIRYLGGKIHRVPRYLGKNHLTYKKVWNKFFKAHPEYKIIHGHVRSTASIYLKIAKRYGLATIAHSHNTSSGTGFLAIVKNTLQYPIRYIADYFFACSENAGIWLFGKKTCEKNNFYILNNAIDTQKFIYNSDVSLKKREEFLIVDKLVIGHIGRFHTQKNHEFLIDIFKELHDRNKNSVLMLVGDGELRKSVEKKVSDLGLTDSVIFTGVRSDIPELLQMMDVFVFPSLYEGLGIVTIEAQAAGVQCIVADTVPDEVFITDLIKKVSLRKSAKAWADIILQCQNYKKRNTIKEIKSAGFDIKDTANKIEAFYQKVYKQALEK